MTDTRLDTLRAELTAFRTSIATLAPLELDIELPPDLAPLGEAFALHVEQTNRRLDLLERIAEALLER